MTAVLWQWLITPWSGASEHMVPDWLAWHARCMVLAWGVLLPVGVVAARYYKVLPSQDWPRILDHKAWWITHRLTQYMGVALMLVGVSLSWKQQLNDSPLASIHTYAGWTLVAAGVFQVLGGLLRGSKGGPTDQQLRGDHYDMTTRRVWFEYLHKTVGWSCMALSIVVIVLGLSMADAPKWMWLTLALWWTALLCWAIYLQSQRRSIDTYQAIWGPSAQHPGNALMPIGWGVHRRSMPLHRDKP